MADTSTGSRPYRSELRKQQAAETRQRVVAAALELFGRQGYRATTFAQLAQEASVSVETVRKHGPKAALLQAAVELASFGVEGETDFFATDHGKAMLEVRDPDEHAGFSADLVLAINAPSAGLWMGVVGAAQDDQELSEFRDHMLSLVRGQVERICRFVAERGWLRSDVPFDDLVEAMCVLTSVETYVRFVLVDGKSTDQYKEFVRRTVRETVLA